MQGHGVRFEKRGRECGSVARLRALRPKPERKRQARSLAFCEVRGGVRKGLKSLGHDQKPLDLALGRVKSRESGMEAR